MARRSRGEGVESAFPVTLSLVTPCPSSSGLPASGCLLAVVTSASLWLCTSSTTVSYLCHTISALLYMASPTNHFHMCVCLLMRW